MASDRCACPTRPHARSRARGVGSPDTHPRTGHPRQWRHSVGRRCSAIWDKEIEIAERAHASEPWKNEKTTLHAFVDKLKQGHEDMMAPCFLQGALASDVCQEGNVTHMEMAVLELRGYDFEHWLTELRLRGTCAILWACPDEATTTIPKKLLQQHTLRAAREYLSIELGYDDDWLEGVRLGDGQPRRP